ncbi:MAG: M14 family metallopeptidase [Candidatus Omnitrophota bacterium]
MKYLNWKTIGLMVLFLLVLVVWNASNLCAAGPEKSTMTFDRYHPPDDVNKLLSVLANAHPRVAQLHPIAMSPGKTQLNILEIGPEIGTSKKKLPAVFVAANMEGTVPLSTEAALYLCQFLLNHPDAIRERTWYILPMGNPDAARHYFTKPLWMNPRNATPYNDDMDDRTDEDGPQDLDGNGLITLMRVKDPQGEWIPVPGEPRLMKKAEWNKGEKGVYKLYAEGLDNDQDGEINEDPAGGVNVGINFPHLFKNFTKTGGPWPCSEAESYSLVKFIFNHPEIAMTLCFGETNFCMVPPRGGRKEATDLSKIKISDWIGKMFGFDTSRTYTFEEIMEVAQQLAPPGFQLTESMVIGFLGLGAAVNPQADDLKFYNEISTQYKEFLKKNKMDTKRLDPAPDKDGSFELWAYYHLGVPSFSLDFWTLPAPEEEKKNSEITPEKLEAMTDQEFLALGEEKINAFLKSAGAPGNINAKALMEMVKGGMMNTKKMAEMMKQMPRPQSAEGADPAEKALLAFSDKHLQGKGFIDWKPYRHPTLGEVEIGGPVPFASNTPPAAMLEALLNAQVPWVVELTQKLPRIKMIKAETQALGSGVYRIDVWVQNTGYLPYPTAMGKRNQRIDPVVVTLDGKQIKILNGLKRTLIKEIPGLGTAKASWVIYTDHPQSLQLTAQSPNAGSDTTTIKIGPGGDK